MNSAWCFNRQLKEFLSSEATVSFNFSRWLEYPSQYWPINFSNRLGGLEAVLFVYLFESCSYADKILEPTAALGSLEISVN